MLIQETLDEIDPTDVSSSSNSKSHPFMQLPESVTSDVFGSDAGTWKTGSNHHHTHRKIGSTAEDLFRLTADLADLNQAEITSAGDPNAATRPTLLDSSERAEALVQMGGSRADLLRSRVLSRRNLMTSRRNLVMEAVEEEENVNSTSHTGSSSSQQENSSRYNEQEGNPKKTDTMRGDEGLQEMEEGKSNTSSHASKNHKRRKKTTKVRMRAQYREFEDWFNLKRPGVTRYIRSVLIFLIIPATTVAAILYYVAENPPCGTTEECERANLGVATSARNVLRAEEPNMVEGTTGNTTETEAPEEDFENFVNTAVSLFQSASVSWWILFLCVRQVVTLSLSFMTEGFLIDFLTLRSKWAVKLFGPFVTLFLVQAHGWPLIAFFWGIYNFALLYGSHRFAEHW